MGDLSPASFLHGKGDIVKGIRKRLTAVLLSCFVAVASIGGCYQTASATTIVEGYTIAQILEMIFASFGISIFTADMIKQGTSASWWTDGSSALDPYYDDLEEAYEKERFRVINGGGGQDPEPSPTPEPEQTPAIQPTPDPGEATPGEIPTFKELLAPLLAGTASTLALTQGAWECLGKAVSSLWDKAMSNEPAGYDVSQDPYVGKHSIGRCRFDLPIYYDNGALKNINSLEYWIYTDETENIVFRYYPSIDQRYTFAPCRLNADGTLTQIKYYYYKVMKDAGYLSSESGEKKAGYYLSGYVPWAGLGEITFYNYLSCPIYKDGQISNEYPEDLNKEMIWVHPDLQDTYKNNGKLEYPQQAPQPLRVPSADELAEFIKKLNPEFNPEYTPEMAPSYVEEFIKKLQPKTDPGTNPDPNPNPNPDPNPDPDPNPNPNPDPNPDPEPGVDPQPTSMPKPTVTPKPDENEDSDIDPKNYAVDLRKIFPFCLPFDLIHLLEVLDAEPEAPRFEIPVDIEAENPFTKKKIVNYHTTIVIDMSDYEEPVKVIRIFEIMFFVLGLMLITRQHMIKG